MTSPRSVQSQQIPLKHWVYYYPGNIQTTMGTVDYQLHVIGVQHLDYIAQDAKWRVDHGMQMFELSPDFSIDTVDEIMKAVNTNVDTPIPVGTAVNNQVDIVNQSTHHQDKIIKAYLFLGPELNPEEHYARIGNLHLYGIDFLAKTMPIHKNNPIIKSAFHAVANGCQQITLCGGFGHHWQNVVAKAIHAHYPNKKNISIHGVYYGPEWRKPMLQLTGQLAKENALLEEIKTLKEEVSALKIELIKQEKSEQEHSYGKNKTSFLR